MQVNLVEIKEKKRLRENIGNLEELMLSLQKHGLLHPVIVDRENRLISGSRRLTAARRLGWQTIEARLIDESDKTKALEIELAENVCRRPLSNEEIARGRLRLRQLRRQWLPRRIGRAILEFFGRLFRRKKRKG